MTDLKTLKDLRFVYPFEDMDECIKFKLKSEAIKWIKENKINEWYNEGWEKFMLHFFNLTEEDLK